MDDAAFAELVAPYRRELRAHCYRMSGSILDADDLLQESLLKAWKGLPAFEGRSSLRTWLYSVTTRACIDALEKKSARRLPRELGPPSDGNVGAPRTDVPWLEPAPSELAAEGTPEARYSRRESVALAFLVALQRLPPRQRAVLILRDVLGFEASECAGLFDLSVAAVNSALQRARETLAQPAPREPVLDDPEKEALLKRYVQAWERADVHGLVAILHEEATLAMPPFAEWLQGASTIGAAIAAMVFADQPKFTLRAVDANGLPAFAVYRDGQPQGIHVVEIAGGKVVAVTAFLEPRLFAAFGL